MLTINKDIEGALEAYLLLLDKGEYFEAHEVLEEAWHHLRLTKNPLANLAKGLINAAIAFEHIRRNRDAATQKAKRVMASYERHKHLCVEDIETFALFFTAIKKVEQLKLNQEL